VALPALTLSTVLVTISGVPGVEPSPLDNAVWHALTSCHEPFAEVAGTARRYLSDISVFAAVERLDPDGWASLAALVGPGGTALLFRPGIGDVPAGWTLRFRGAGNQFVADDLRPPVAGAAPPIVALGPDDNEAMIALTALARPGPFTPRTRELGRYYGVFERGDLIAMAGERFHSPGYTEISAVSTHPSARGRGLAAHLTHHVARAIIERDELPYLHVADGNDGARRVYERLGFTLRTPVDVVGATLQE
jgi:GNAT superfamily N-acetyltransferase